MRTSETTQIIQEEFNKAYQIWGNTRETRDELIAERKALELELETDDRTI